MSVKYVVYLDVFQHDLCVCDFYLQAFAKEGAKVTATDINGEKLQELDSVQGLKCVDFVATCWQNMCSGAIFCSYGN